MKNFYNLVLLLILNQPTMSKFLEYINDVLESLDIPTISNSTSKKFNSTLKNHQNDIHIKGN